MKNLAVKLLAIASVFCVSVSKAQTLIDFADKSPSELNQEIAKSKPGLQRVVLLVAQGCNILNREHLHHQDIFKADSFRQVAVQLSNRLNEPAAQGYTQILASLVYQASGNAEKAQAVARQAVKTFTASKEKFGEAYAWMTMNREGSFIGDGLSRKVKYGQRALDLFSQINEKHGQALALCGLSEAQLEDYSKLAIGKNKAETGIAICKAGHFYKEQEFLDGMVARYYIRTGDQTTALQYCFDALHMAALARDTSVGPGSIYSQISMIYGYLQKTALALRYGQTAYEITKHHRDTIGMSNTAACIFQAYVKLKKTDKALQVYKMISPMIAGGGDMAAYERKYYQVQLLRLYTGLNQLDKAAPYFKLLQQQLHSDTLEDYMIRGMIPYALAAGKYQLAYKYLAGSQWYLARPHALRSLSLNELWYFKADSATGKLASAIGHYQRYKMYNDSDLSLAKNQQYTQLQLQFDAQRKDDKLRVQLRDSEQKAQLQQQRAKANLSMLAGGIAAMILILAIGYNRYRIKRRTNRQLEQQQKEINRQNAALQSLIASQDQLLLDKDWLLKEVHHRVKNNLQIIMSLLSSQSAYLENTAAIEAIRESQNRVQAISLIHQKLYKSSNVASINMQAYVADLLEYLADSFDTRKRRIRFEQVIEPFNLDLAQAVPIGLILNESVTNAIKYAFGEAGGQIIVALQLIKDEKLLLTIADDGHGFPKEPDLEESDTLGMVMMKVLSKQLGGEFKIENKSGARISIEFQIEKVWPGLNEHALHDTIKPC